MPHAAIAQLNKAACEEIQNHVKEIAQGLVNAAKGGNVSCVRLLVEMAESDSELNEPEHASPLTATIERLKLEEGTSLPSSKMGDPHGEDRNR